MPTIDEAREAVLAAVSAHAFDNAPAGDVGAALTVYGLAVLDEAFSYDQRHNHSKIELGCCDYHALRARIKGGNDAND